MQYWLDLFTGTTWREFQHAGANVTGFSNRMRRTVEKMRPGDILLCYLTGVMRWVGALEVVGPSSDARAIWSVAEFPARVSVRPVVSLSPENGVPMSELEGKVEFYLSPADRPGYKGFVRRSPNLFRRGGDGDLLLQLIRQAHANPVSRPVDPAKLARRPLLKAETRKGKRTVEAFVSVPDPSDDEGEGALGATPAGATTPHTEVQHRLLRLGA